MRVFITSGLGAIDPSDPRYSFVRGGAQVTPATPKDRIDTGGPKSQTSLDAQNQLRAATRLRLVTDWMTELEDLAKQYGESLKVLESQASAAAQPDQAAAFVKWVASMRKRLNGFAQKGVALYTDIQNLAASDSRFTAQAARALSLSTWMTSGAKRAADLERSAVQLSTEPSTEMNAGDDAAKTDDVATGGFPWVYVGAGVVVLGGVLYLLGGK
jgi:hypothetical protein